MNNPREIPWPVWLVFQATASSVTGSRTHSAKGPRCRSEAGTEVLEPHPSKGSDVPKRSNDPTATAVTSRARPPPGASPAPASEPTPAGKAPPT